MRLDRRQFMQIGAIAAFGGSGCKRSQEPSPAPTAPPIAAAAAVPSVRIQFEGLYLIEQKGTSMVVHLIDGPAVNLPAHTAQMQALASTIDQSKTAKPDAAHIVPAGGSDDFWLFDLKGLDVTGPASANGVADLTSDQSSSDDGLEVPSGDAGWHSLARVPDLRVLCGATHITKFDAFSSSVTLNHGHLGVVKPVGIGVAAVWKCTDNKGNELMRRAFSNKVRYSCPTNGQPLAIQVGSQQIVFKPNTVAEVSVFNLPPKSPCPAPCTPNMHHFSAFLAVVDSKFPPSIDLDHMVVPAGSELGADYCPGGRI
jgi:hypothetical protein